MPPPTQTRAAATLHRIVEATRMLLARGGYDSLSMRAVAAEAGVTAGAIYKHFPGKLELVDHVCLAALEDFQAELTRAITPLPPGSFDRVVALGTTYIRFATEKPEHFKILFTPARPRPIRLRDLPGEGGFRILRDCVADAMESGAMRRAEPDLAAFLLWSRVHGIVTVLMACDFRDSLSLPPEDIHPLHLFELSREFLSNGFELDARPGDARRREKP